MAETWREIVAPIIAKAIAECADPEQIPEALRRAYPERWGKKHGNPYRTWLDDARRQLGLRKKPDPRQGGLFGGEA